MRVEVLGPIQVRTGPGLRDTLALGGPRQRAVLAVLALFAGSPVDVGELIDAVWGAAPPRTATHTLHNYVLRLRRLGLEIERVGTGYLLRTPTDTELLLAGGDPEGLLELVRGEPAEGVEDGDLIRAPRAALVEVIETLREDAAQGRLERAEDAAQAARLIPQLRRLVAGQPYRERRWELLILGLYLAGRQQESLAAFAQVRKLLNDDLGIDPGPALQRLQQAVLAQDPTLLPGSAPAGSRHPTVAGRALPGLATRLIGRERERAVIASALLSSRLVTLVGPMGAGKSRLALEEARRVSGPVWFVPMEGLAAPTSIAGAALAAVSPMSRAGDPRGGLLAALADSPGLIVLDAAEQRLDEARSLAADLLDHCPRLRCLVTSRQPLELPGEARVTVSDLTTADRRALLLDRAALADPGFTMAAEDTAAADRLCELVDGLPLGIELVARHLRLLSLRELADRVDADLERWTSVGGSQGLIRAVATSVESLEPAMRDLLARLSVLSAEADLATVHAVAAPGSEIDDVFDTLVALVDRSLVQVRGGPAGIRYGVLLSVRRYCLATLTEADRRGFELLATHAVLRRCAEHAALMLAGEREPALLALDADAPLLRAAFSAGLEGPEAPEALRVATALGGYWLARRPSEGLAWLQRLLDVATVAEVPRAEALLQMGHLCYWTNEFGLGERLLEEARSLIAPAGPSPLLGRVLRRLGAIAAARDEVARARELLEQSAQALHAIGAEFEEALSLLHLGSLLADLGLADRALPLLIRSRDVLARSGDSLQHGHALSALMLAWWKSGDLAAAQGAGEAALACFEQLGQTTSQGVATYRLAAVFRAQGRPGRARECAAQALTAGLATSTRTTIALAHVQLARLDLDATDVAAAAEHLAEALTVVDVEEDRWVLADILETTARLQLLRGRPGLALLHQAAELRSAIDQPPPPTDAAEIRGLMELAAAEPAPGRSDDLALARVRALDLCRAVAG